MSHGNTRRHGDTFGDRIPIDFKTCDSYIPVITHPQLAVGSKAVREKSLAAFALRIPADMRTTVYIDGFNLYYRMLKGKPGVKWLNPKALAEAVLNPNHNVTQVNYYTARISARPNDPGAPARQAVYLKALSTIPEVAVHEGSFLTSEPWMALAQPPAAKPNGYAWTLPAPDVVKVMKTEEKGSDVNLASHLVRDAFLDAFDVAVILTNDSDLVEPVRIAVQEAGKRVGVLVPVKYPTQSLINAASFHLHIRPGHLTKAQFLNPIVMPDGSQLACPPGWL